MSKDCWYGKVDDKVSINLHDVSIKLVQVNFQKCITWHFCFDKATKSGWKHHNTLCLFQLDPKAIVVFFYYIDNYIIP
jgi:hypothetical protein